jgi:type IV pilus assembly protein PilA
MAVLVGVLAPQYLKYVERSRAATDRDNVDAVISAFQVYGSDPDVASADQLKSGDSLTISRTAIATAPSGAVGKALKNAGIDYAKLQFKNTSTFASVTVEVKTDADTGALSVEASGTGY